MKLMLLLFLEKAALLKGWYKRQQEQWRVSGAGSCKESHLHLKWQNSKQSYWGTRERQRQRVCQEIKM